MMETKHLSKEQRTNLTQDMAAVAHVLDMSLATLSGIYDIELEDLIMRFIHGYRSSTERTLTKLKDGDI